MVLGDQEIGVLYLPIPKMELPKFVGTNPRLWRDHYEMYFEVYSVVTLLKTWFVALISLV